jgi:hypothetical protein
VLDIPFLQFLTLDSILYAAHELVAGCKTLRSSDQLRSMRTSELIVQLNQLHTCIKDDAYSDSTARDMHTMFPLIHALEDHARVSAVEVRIQRQLIMLGNWAAYSWVRKLLDHAWSSGPEDLSWPCRLMRKVDLITTNFAHQADSAISIDPSHYIPGLNAKPYDYVPSNSGRRYLDEGDRRKETANIFFRIIQQWLGYPSDDLAYARFLFADVLIAALAGDTTIFLLGPVWDAYLRPKSQLLGNRKLRTDDINVNSFITLHKQLQVHPILTLSSSLRSALNALGYVFREWQQLAHALHKFPARRIHQQDAANSPALQGGVSTADLSNEVAGMERFLHFIQALIPLLDPTNTQPLSKLQKKVNANRDRFLPFKMLQPALIAIMGNNGPFSERWIRTRAGFFSALVFRAITFGALAGQLPPGLFKTLQDWRTFLKLHQGKGRKWLCVENAYGPWQKNRTPSLASDLWQSSSLWSGFIAKEVNFDSLIDFLTKDHPGKFPNIGPLTAFLLAGDYAHTPLIPMPTPEVIGKHIHNMKKGAYDGLQRLGLLHTTYKKNDASATVEKFQLLYNFLDNRLTAEEKSLIVFNGLMLENALCKYKRSEQAL